MITAHIYNLGVAIQNYVNLFLANILKSGPIPKHIGFVMDGNRRWAQERNFPILAGHGVGYGKAVELIDACQAVGIPEMSWYFLGHHNFRRARWEVDNLVYVLDDLYKDLVDRPHLLMDRGVKVMVHGNMDKMPDSSRKPLAKLVLMTKDNDKFRFNIGHVYSGQDELTVSVNEIRKGVEMKTITLDDIDEKLITTATHIPDMGHIDLMIRTSGVHRMSDYLSWHMHGTTLKFFDNLLWPDFSFWHFTQAVSAYQRSAKHATRIEKEIATIIEQNCKTANQIRQKKFAMDLEDERFRQFQMCSQLTTVI